MHQLSKSLRIILIILIISSISIGLLPNYIEIQTSPQSKGPFTCLTSDPSTSIIITWETTTNQDAVIYYGLSTEDLNNSEENTTLSTIHHIELINLSPNSTYYYKVGSFNPQSQNLTIIAQFRTAPIDKSTSFDFIAISDTQQLRYALGWFKPLFNDISQITTNFLTIVGDLVEDGTTESDWNDLFYNMQSVMTKTPLVPVVGNHESNLLHTNQPSYWDQNYFPISQSQTQFYYSFTYSMVHFTILDIEWGTQSDLTVDQLSWLKSDLANAQNVPFRIVLFHCPVRDSGYFGDNQLLQTQLTPILLQYNVSLVLNGHDHHYERLNYNGLNIIVLGSGGALQDPIIVSTPNTLKVILEPCYTRIFCNMTAIAINTYSLTNEILDQDIITNGGGN
jgi:3',5'-cyclic AMP phosphodiesterase CpdA